MLFQQLYPSSHPIFVMRLLASRFLQIPECGSSQYYKGKCETSSHAWNKVRAGKRALFIYPYDWWMYMQYVKEVLVY